jgi:hypothetical protein
MKSLISFSDCTSDEVPATHVKNQVQGRISLRGFFGAANGNGFPRRFLRSASAIRENRAPRPGVFDVLD